MSFVHLHVHTQYSILDGLSSIKSLFARARELCMPAIAITDHGNMYGVKEFFDCAYDEKNLGEGKKPVVKPIAGCEIYVSVYDHTIKDPEHRAYYHLTLLAKNYEGYKNLMKIVSTGHIEGKYYDKPRVSHEVVAKYHENLICCSACLAGEIPRKIIAGNTEELEAAVKWHKEIFGDDYYFEVMLHRSEIQGLTETAMAKIREVEERQEIVNAEIFRLAEKFGVKVVATNDAHFVKKEDAEAHDRLICLTTNSNVDDEKRLRYTRQEYIKSEEEMAALFPDHPEVIANTLEVASKVELYTINRDPVLPKFEIDSSFMEDMPAQLKKYEEVIDAGRNDKKGNYRGDEFCWSVAYLCHLTYLGAKERYGEPLTAEQSERIDFELKTICRMGFPDYFLIVQDYINAMRRQGWMVGPGRGSAAGAVVAYCLHITNLDPLKYNLLFERFLNPDRVSMPDIDVDFENLTAAHDYVEKKYGKDHVSRVITFGTMAAKGSIKDVARISNVSLEDSVRLSKMVPDHLSEKTEVEYPFNPKLDTLKPGFTLVKKEVEVDDPQNEGQKTKVEKQFQKGKEDKDVKINLANCFRLVPEFKNELENGEAPIREMLQYARQLEGSIRQVGQHACATIIGRGNLMDYIPICLSKDQGTGLDVWTSQYDGHFIESVGMLKMDFLGLNTLSIIHATLDLIKKTKGEDIDIEAIPIDDMPTYELYGRGDTTAVFQFESEGMKTWLQKLHPSRFEDLIAMNALYRPGPMDYIPDFVARKQGLKPIEYDLPDMKPYLEDTYGITVYQEQVMQLSQKLADFTKGQADKLRKAMGKKQIDTLNSLKDKFMAGGANNGYPEKTLDKIWKDWEKFAQYAFNKSHATCYAWVSYQTGWLKCHYPSEFFAANLSCNLSNMDEIKKLMDDCRKSGIKVLSPDINESGKAFTVNAEGNIRFGMAGIKGIGENVVSEIIREREKNGLFKDIFDFVERVPSRLAGRKMLENLIYAGAFDGFKDVSRADFFAQYGREDLFIDALVKYAINFQNDTMSQSANLFGAMEELKPVRPAIPRVEEFNALEFLKKEKELVGMYLSSHPLDRYRFEMENFVTTPMSRLREVDSVLNSDKSVQNRTFITAGLVVQVDPGFAKNGKPMTSFIVEDYTGSYNFKLFGKDYDRFSQFATLNAPILIKCASKLRYRQKDASEDAPEVYSIQIQNIIHLPDATEKFIKEMHIAFPLNRCDASLRKKILGIIKKHKGKARLFVDLGYSFENEADTVTMFSKKYSVEPSFELISAFDALGIPSKTVILPPEKWFQ